ncbi:family 5 glycoside hydrolase [Melampsora larici-populina 98AG31]|uniref:cellulase n=1 Tax=Melampsora larici-populina (strain 98AG31 / pathotype 3-4-7) TaxID=747676 RepID=F4S2U5_MELLP|nr:family 5 glycoside hydrolase [Melampsora larici-populina 98AG31]EGG01066.1 family 5 glycoside hydrolase [Melampsora larici-populina 98AG31]
MNSNLQTTLMLLCALFSVASCRSIWTGSGEQGETLLQRRENSVPDQAGHRSDHLLPRMNGVNMAGLEFGIGSNGDRNGNPPQAPPLDQIPHFIKGGSNVIRFPFGWQYMQDTIKGDLNKTYLSLLDEYVTATTQLNATAIIEVHNFARRDGQIIGESSVGADALVDLWTRLAKHYNDQPNVMFGLMNEPHDVTSKIWIGVVQQVVTGIRKAGAENNILLPGNAWEHLLTFADDYNNGLSAIKNPDGSVRGLIFEIHQYFDYNGVGDQKECTQDHLSELQSVVDLLKKDGRQVLITELGGGNSQSCSDIIHKFVAAAASAYPTVIGTLMWGAGSFAPDYTLVVTVKEGNGWKDQMNFASLKTALAAV